MVANTYPNNSFISLVPRLKINGPANLTIDQDIISIQFKENLERCNLLEVNINNWGTTASGNLGFLYSDTNLLCIGANVSFCLGDFILAEAKIASVETIFPESGPPSLMFTADAWRPSWQTPTQTVIALSHGSDLLELRTTLQKTENTSLPKLKATGTAKAPLNLMPGATIEIKSVDKFSKGKYLVTETSLTYDRMKGLRTGFICEKKGSRITSKQPSKVIRT